MNRSESKYFNTAVLMDEALVFLLGKKDFEYITVKEICEKAGVNRSTFYLHYETVGDLLTECMDYINDKFVKSFGSNENFVSTINDTSLDNLILVRTEFLRPYLNFIKENKAVFSAAYKNPSGMQSDRRFDSLSKYVLRPIMTRFSIPENEQPYWISFFIHGCSAVIMEWIARDFKESVEDIESILLHCIRPEGESYADTK